MGLNLITNEGAQNLSQYYRNSLTDPENQNIDFYEAYFTLGLLAWREGDSEQLKNYLALAAKEVVFIVEARDVKNLEAERMPDSVALPFLMVMNFGDAITIKKLAALSRQRWFQPETDEYRPLADLLDILRDYFSGISINLEQLKILVKLNNYPGTNLFYRPWIEALAQGLLAVVQKDKASAEKCLYKLLELHEDMALEGAWKNLAEGLLSFWALTLHRVAESEGVILDIKSPYFPQ